MDIPKGSKSRKITIAEEEFKIPQPIEEGHVCTAGQASTLNQTLAENVRNNFRIKVKEAAEAGTDMADVQKEITAYIKEYEFGARRGGGGRTANPTDQEAMTLARGLVKKALLKKGVNLSETSAKEISNLARGLIDKNPKIRERAAQIVKAREEAAAELTNI